MKKTGTFLILLSLVLSYSCKKDEKVDVDKTIAKVGNFWQVDVSGYENATLTVTDNDNGKVTADIVFGSETLTITGKVTEDGIWDYVYSNGDESKPFKLVEFGDEVGKTWSYNVGGQTVTRQVTYKSTDDDTFYGFLLVKVIEVEETIPQGISVVGRPSNAKKILWSFNHRFGLIYATVTLNDDSVVDVYTQNSNTDTKAK
jgi:hypothetical protein